MSVMDDFEVVTAALVRHGETEAALALLRVAATVSALLETLARLKEAADA
jgi:hypothetical protein